MYNSIKEALECVYLCTCALMTQKGNSLGHPPSLWRGSCPGYFQATSRSKEVNNKAYCHLSRLGVVLGNSRRFVVHIPDN